MNLIIFVIVLIHAAFAIAAARPIDVVFIIQSQNAKYQNESSRKLKENIIKQSMELKENYRIKVHLLHEIFNYPGGWTIHNLIPQLMLLQRKQNIDSNTTANANASANKHEKDMQVISENTRWIVFCEDKTGVKLKLLMENLNNENHTQLLYLGYPLHDREPTIIHHFAFFENPKWFPFPMLRAGVIFSLPLFKSVDAGHELARFIYDNIPFSTQQHDGYHEDHRTFYGEVNKISNKENFATTNELKRYEAATLSHNGSFNADDSLNVFDVSHSNICIMSSNEIKNKQTDEISKPSGGNMSNSSTSSGLTNPTNSSSSSFFTKKQKKIILKKASYICPFATWETRSKSSSNNNHNNDEPCAMYVEKEQTTNAASSLTCTPVRREEIYFAVKTCSKYHHERLPVIQSTWASYAKHVKYFSDTQDDAIPTTKTGILNVEMGHCAKTLKILSLAFKDILDYNNKQQELHQVDPAAQEYHQIKWLFLADDDTILSVSGVCQLLGCYNSMDEIYLGERYGYRLHAPDGFNYITGGGGIAFSLPVVELILQHCSCPSPTAPDDMILGSCLHSLQLKPLHSSRFHQARPNDYPFELLQQEAPISFHKFWQLDPVDVYNRWFATKDRLLLAKGKPDYDEGSKKDYHIKSYKPEGLNLNQIPVSFVATVHHSKERHVDLK